MAQYRQQSTYTNGVGGPTISSAPTTSTSSTSAAAAADHVAIGIRQQQPSYYHHHHHHKKHRRSKNNNRRISIGTAITLVCFILTASAFAFLFLSTRQQVHHHHHTGHTHRTDNDSISIQDDAYREDFLDNVTRFTPTKVGYGRDSGTHGRDSREWDGDDRRRDEDYNEDEVHKSSKDSDVQTGEDHISSGGNDVVKNPDHNVRKHTDRPGLYDESGRDELRIYEEKYEASLKNHDRSGVATEGGNHASDDHNSDVENEEIDIDDEYDDGIDLNDARIDYDDVRHEDGMHSEVTKTDTSVGKGRTLVDQSSSQDSSTKSDSDNTVSKTRDGSITDGQSSTSSGKRSKRHRKHHSSSSCELKLLNSTAQLVEPLESRKFSRFSLSYTEREEKPDGVIQWEPRFAGHQSLREREDSFLARDQKINCGFVNGPKEFSGTGFDMAEDDIRYIGKCHIAVVSCIFGNSDRLRSPFTKAVSRLSRKNVCFVMFMDEMTLQTLSSEGQMPDRDGHIGLWKVVVVKNLPFTDMRRVGKIPKLLTHRLFPSARYSIWLDSKLRLQRDPLLLLERFLWRKGYEYAISNHYDRHCVWEEVDRNKKLNKFNHTMIDQQFQFYQADGLKRFNASDPNKMLPSNVPEGSLIIRAHTPMSNMFSCLWFNEVDRFTPRDQLSFAYTYQKLKKKNPSKPFHLHMFKDCERRQIAKLFHHRTDEKRSIAQDAAE